jgi:hypothetical protein
MILLGEITWNFKSIVVGDETLSGSLGVNSSITGACLTTDSLESLEQMLRSLLSSPQA